MLEHALLRLEAPERLVAGQFFILTLRLSATTGSDRMLYVTCSHPDLFGVGRLTWPLQFALPAALDKLVVPLTARSTDSSVEVTFHAWQEGHEPPDSQQGRVSIRVQLTP